MRILQFNVSYNSVSFDSKYLHRQVFGLNVQVSGVNSPQWNKLFTQRQKLVCNSPRLGVKLSQRNGPFSPNPMLKACMLPSKILPQTYKKITQIYLPYLWHYATLHMSQMSHMSCMSRESHRQFFCLPSKQANPHLIAIQNMRFGLQNQIVGLSL